MLSSLFVVAMIPIPAVAGLPDALPSWNNTPNRAAIVEFVNRVTTPGSLTFVPPAERVAVFDNDGTLWAEQPMYFQLTYAFDRVRSMAPQHPEWKNDEPFASILKGDMEQTLTGGEHAILKILMATHGGISATEFQAQVREWLSTARHPVTGRAYDRMAYQPMLELLTYLRARGFKTYIVSGGGIDFIRVFAEHTYGIPPEQVIGSSNKATYQLRDGKPVITKLPELNFVDDKAGKPVAIHHHIGRRPIAAFGNSDGDFQMLEWTTSRRDTLSLGVIVHHDDAQREWSYDRESHIGRLDRGLTEAGNRKWIVASMKRDWKRIYPPE
jgi:phosphoglycolate phosphatase-like HAD superfamily hydrolase